MPHLILIKTQLLAVLCLLALSKAELIPLATLPLTFTSTVLQSHTEHGKDAQPPQKKEFQLASSKENLALYQQDVLSDGRLASSFSLFREGSVFRSQPFFGEAVCFQFDLPTIHEAGNASAHWLDSTLKAMGLYADLFTNNFSRQGNATVDGQWCDIWEYKTGDDREPEQTMISYRLCLGAGRRLLRVNLTNSYRNPELFVATTMTQFLEYKPSYNAPNALPSTCCVNLTSGGITYHARINDDSRLDLINREAQGRWHASRYASFDTLTLRDVQKMLGTRIRPLSLPLAQASFTDGILPQAFDWRLTQPRCHTISSIRNQGSCGACWAFAAAEVLADRLCIAGINSDFVGSVQYMIDCDKNDTGCSGGFLDDAWQFLVKTGVSSETCNPYQFCSHPEIQNCSGPPTAQIHPAECSSCQDGSLPLHIKAHSAYAVAKPGDVNAMQRDMMQNGPIEVAFFVFSDFPLYSNGTYFRTPGAEGPMGGHAVRLLGWGVDEHGIDYWLAANSWSAAWGENGFFRIRRGTNECGIETTPAAGLVRHHLTEKPLIDIQI